MSKRTVLITTGGTGGHVFPAIALAEELEKDYNCSIYFAGGKLSQNRFFEGEKWSFQDITCGQLGWSPFKVIRGVMAILKGMWESYRLIKQLNPDAVVGFGSYHTLPVLLAATLNRSPFFLHEANSIPGRVNRLFAPMAEKIFVHFPQTRKFLGSSAVVGGMPIRNLFRKGQVSREEACKAFQLSPKQPVILVFGGSQGAKRLNDLFSCAAVFHLKESLPNLQILHFTGSHDECQKMMECYVSAQIPAYVRPFEKRMDLAWAAADMAVTRAGAASIAEQLAYGIPGILIPYPYATDNHQSSNADFFVHTGLGIKIEETGLTPQVLAQKVKDVFSNLTVYHDKFGLYQQHHLEISIAKQINQWVNSHAKATTGK